MIRLVFGSITASLLIIAPVQNVAAKQPSNQHSFAQFCRDLQAKDDFTANPDEIAEFATKFANEFATKTQWRFDRHQLGQRGPDNSLAIHLSNRSKNDGKAVDCFHIGQIARNARRDFARRNTPFTIGLYPRLYDDRNTANQLS